MSSNTKIANFAQRATVTGLVGMGVWGLWLTAAVFKSRRGEGAQQNLPPHLRNGEHPMHDAPIGKPQQHVV